jgi:hypothetical protein
MITAANTFERVLLYPNPSYHPKQTLNRRCAMRKYWSIFGLLLVLMLAMTQSSSAVVSTITYNFSGTCTDCRGTATATLVLVGGYTLGTPITGSNLVSFTYNGTNLQGPFTYTPSTPGFSVTGSMTNIPGFNTFSIVSNSGLFFSSTTSGTWLVNVTDQGTAGTWSLPGGSPPPATPAPPTVILLVAGLMSLAVFRVWQRQRQTT